MMRPSLALALLLAACPLGGTAVAKPQAPACSASTLSAVLPAQSGLPPAVVRMRQSIADAAVRCDFEQLQRLGMAGKTGFSYTFGNPEGAAKLWRQGEAAGEPVLATLVKLLQLPYTVDRNGPQPLYIWPAIAGKDNPTEADWRQLEAFMSPKDIARLRAVGTYMGYRVGITADGDWTFFIAGD